MDFFANPKKSINQFMNEWWSPSANAVTIDSRSVLSIPAFFRGAKIISEALATLPIGPYEIKRNGDMELRMDLPDYKLLTVAPNNYQTAFNFWDAIVFNLVIHGNAVVIRQLANSGQTKSFFIVPHEEVVGVWLDHDGLVYDCGRYGKYVESEVLHFAGTSYNGIWGLSLIELFCDTLATDKSTTKYSRKYYENGAIVRGILSFPNTLRDETYERVKKGWNDMHVGVDGTNQTPLLEGGATYQSITPKMMEAGITEMKKLTTEEIARMLGIPLHMLMSLDKATFSNITQQYMEFMQRVAIPYATRISAELTRKLGSNRIKWFYDTQELLLGDLAAMADYNTKMFKSAFLNRNEVRRKMRLNSVPGGDEFYIESNNMSPISQLGKNNGENDNNGDVAPKVVLEPTIQG